MLFSQSTDMYWSELENVHLLYAPDELCDIKNRKCNVPLYSNCHDDGVNLYSQWKE